MRPLSVIFLIVTSVAVIGSAFVMSAHDGTDAEYQNLTNNVFSGKPGDFMGDNGLLYSPVPGTAEAVLSGHFMGLMPDNGAVVNIPRTITYSFNGIDFTEYTVVSIGDGAFKGCTELRSVTIPDSVTVIGERAFERCLNLQSVVIPGSVTVIGKSAFYECISMDSVVMLDGVREIGQMSFYMCHGLRSVVIPDSVTTIRNSAFGLCTSLASVDLASVETIGAGAFYGCKSLESVVIPGSVISIGQSAFLMSNTNDTSLRSVTILSSPSMGPQAFQNCSLLTYLDLGSVEYVGDYAFFGCLSLTSVVIPGSVTVIGESAFEMCVSLERVTIPEGVTTIGNNAFSGCTKLGALAVPYSVTDPSALFYKRYAPDAHTAVIFYGGISSVTAYRDVTDDVMDPQKISIKLSGKVSKVLVGTGIGPIPDPLSYNIGNVAGNGDRWEFVTHQGHKVYSMTVDVYGRCECYGALNGCDCIYGLICGACIRSNECGCVCIHPVRISGAESLAGGGNRSRIVTVNTGSHPSDDLWLIVIYKTTAMNYSFLVKADREVELFYQTNITGITVRLADGIPKILGGDGYSGSILGSDCISRNVITFTAGKEPDAKKHAVPGGCRCAVDSYNMCDCGYGMKCGVCIELSNRNMICDCDCIAPISISGTDRLAGDGNRTRIVTVNSGTFPVEDMWLVVIYGTVTTNFSFVMKAYREVELFYPSNVISITVRLTDGIPNNIGGGSHNGFVFGTDRIII